VVEAPHFFGIVLSLAMTGSDFGTMGSSGATTIRAGARV
jgi:hypothetical protein